MKAAWKNKWIILMAIGASLAAMLLADPGEVKADTMGTTTVAVSWGGTPCISVQMVTGRYDGACGGYHEWVNSNSYPGTITGVDPIMGSADWINCSVYVNGQFQYSDYAQSGDGTDVNCITDIYDKGYSA